MKENYINESTIRDNKTNNNLERFKIREIEHFEDMSKTYKRLGILDAVASGLFVLGAAVNLAVLMEKDNPSLLMQLPIYVDLFCTVGFAKLSKEYFEEKKNTDEYLEKLKSKTKHLSK